MGSDENTTTLGDASRKRPREDARRLRRGTSIGRYLVIDLLGRGGMGEVYAAWDSDLQRRVALKIVHDTERDGHHKRLRDEARALAHLRHPNIVAVHEVGGSGDTMFIAMEYLEGLNMAAWLADRPHARDRLSVLMQCAAGLSAAHARGVIHRDFKPSNVMIEATESGPVAKIVDFGVATRGLDGPSALRGGTPKYMAPECRNGARGDARSDQWSFARTAREALDVPALATVLDRALQDDPQRRWPSVHALADAMSDAFSRRPGRWRIGVAALALVGVLGWGWAASKGDCQRAAQAALEGAVSASLTDAAVVALEGIDGTLSASVRTRIDVWSRAWREAHAAQCSDDSQERERTRDCLEGQAVRMSGLLSVFADPGEDASGSWSLFAELARSADPRACSDASSRDDATGKGRAFALEVAARYDDALAAVHEEREQLGVDALVGERALLAFREASIRRRRGELDVAGDSFLESMELAAQAGDHGLVARAMLERVMTLVDGGRYVAAVEAIALARAPVRATGDDPHLLASWFYFRSVALEATNELKNAVLSAEESLRIRTETMPGSMYEADSRYMIATISMKLGSCDVALEEYDRADRIFREHVGARHPLVAHVMGHRAICLTRVGRVDEGLAQSRQAVELLEELPGSYDNYLGKLLTMQAITLAELRRYDESVEPFARAVVVRRRSLGDDHDETATAQTNLASVLIELGRVDEARPHLEAAESTLRNHHGADAPQLAVAMEAFAQAQAKVGNTRAALERLQAALRARERGPDGTNIFAIATMLTNIGLLEVELGDPHARTTLERVRAGLAAHPNGRQHPVWPEIERALRQLDGPPPR